MIPVLRAEARERGNLQFLRLIKLLKQQIRIASRLQLFFLRFFTRPPHLGMHLGFRESRRIQNQPQRTSLV
ncbi:hypothetical protein DJ62_3651 [Yersinia enterocolitica]|nr:hypothetical protein DJ62_3651 [Yersinia enterocolitica]